MKEEGIIKGFMIYFYLSGAKFHPNIWILLTPVLLLLMAGIGLGLGIIISAFTIRYRDLQFLVQFGAVSASMIFQVVVTCFVFDGGVEAGD